jgi:ABC-type bacteriocin/lantibiotic exporter with double-glycine peptidase domain
MSEPATEAASLPSRNLPAASTPPLSFRAIWELLSRYRARAVIVMALVLVDTALASLGVGIVLPVLQAILDPTHRSTLVTRFLPFFDQLSPDARLISLALATVALFAAKSAIGMATVVHSHRLLQRLRFYWVDQIGVYYLCGPFGRFAFRKQGELLNDWFNETLSGTRFLQSYLTYISSLVLVAALVLLGFIVEWRAMLALLVLYLIVALVVRKTLYARSSTLGARKLQTNQALSATMVEDLSNLRDIKLMRAEDARLHHLRDLSDRLGRIFLRSAVVGEVPRVISELIAVALLMGLVIVSAVWLRLRPEVMFPIMVFFSVTAYRLVSAASQMMGARIRTLNEMQSLRRVHDLVLQAQEREVLDCGVPLERIETDLVLRDVNYAYGAGAPVVVDVNAVIPRGKVTFLLGPSGAGKSTLLDLLLRLIDPTSGGIEANGRPASEFRLADWRRAFGYVSQEAALFNGTIRMNLQLARPQATEDEIVESCRLAGADQFVRLLPEGYDTVVGDRGHSLSGGQRKRVAIARALIGRPSVLILDEATTSFEQSLEREMLRVLKAALPDLTIVQVTHRLQSMANADWVIALDGGRLVASGSWQDTMAELKEAQEVLWSSPK